MESGGSKRHGMPGFPSIPKGIPEGVVSELVWFGLWRGVGYIQKVQHLPYFLPF